ncbi:MAG: peroxide stress protein YaaA [Microbacteriaceae bacterium]
MLLLLPPSETKRDGGEPGRPLALERLSFPELTAGREACLDALLRLSRSESASLTALRLSQRQRGEVERNRALRVSPTMPAVDRFTGVLFEALGAEDLDADARAWLGRSVAVHSALLGLVGALDPVPAYRLSHDSRLPGLRLRQHWAAAITAAIAERPGLVVDLRSDAYAALGPLPAGERFVAVRVLAEGPEGARRPLNHFNKRGKGELVRTLALARVQADDVEELLAAARGLGVRLERSGPSELTLLVG